MLFLSYVVEYNVEYKTERQINMKNQNTTTIAAVLIVIMLIVNFNLFNRIVTDNVPENLVQNIPVETPEEAAVRLIEDDIKNNFTDLDAKACDTKCGELVLVDSTHAFDFEAQTSLFPTQSPECVYDSKSDNYYVKDRTVLLNKTAIEALNSLLDAFAAETSHKDIIIVDGHRTLEWQKVVLDSKIEQLGQEEGKKIATQPGYSEHHTGYALDISLFINGVRHTYDGTGDYEWITQNCAKFGFVIRYPEDKTTITNISYEPWHLRYVGKPHAEYMTQNNLCLEEYIDRLANYPIDSARLAINTSDGGKYEVYSCSVLGDSAKIKVPKSLPYTLSGDNAGHIIVTVDKSELQG